MKSPVIYIVFWIMAMLSAEAECAAKRVVTLSPHLTEMMFALDAEDLLVAVASHSDYPAAALDLPVIADAFSVNLESLVGLRPDLVLVWQSSAPVGLLERLESLDIATFVSEPKDFESFVREMRTLGRLLDRIDEAELQASSLADRLRRLRAGAARRTFVQLSAPEIYTITRQHFLEDVLKRCGFANVFAELGGAAPKISSEAVLAAQVEVVLAFDDVLEAARSQWEPHRLPIWSVPADLLSRPGPRLIEGAEVLCELSRNGVMGHTNGH